MQLNKSYTISFSINPYKWVRNLLVACGLIVSVGLPIGKTTDAMNYTVPKTVTQISRENAVQAVDAILTERMTLEASRRHKLAEVIVRESVACSLDPLFVLAVGDAESRFDHEAVSPTGARGLFQVVPSTWKREEQRRNLGHLEKFNELNNARIGIGYLCVLSQSFKRGDSLLLAYNQGPGTAKEILNGNSEPTDEARTYAGKVWKSYKSFLVRYNINTDPKNIRVIYKVPTATVYTTLVGYQSDVHGPQDRLLAPVKVKVHKPRLMVSMPQPKSLMADSLRLVLY